MYGEIQTRERGFSNAIRRFRRIANRKSEPSSDAANKQKPVISIAVSESSTHLSTIGLHPNRNYAEVEVFSLPEDKTSLSLSPMEEQRCFANAIRRFRRMAKRGSEPVRENFQSKSSTGAGNQKKRTVSEPEKYPDFLSSISDSGQMLKKRPRTVSLYDCGLSIQSPSLEGQNDWIRQTSCTHRQYPLAALLPESYSSEPLGPTSPPPSYISPATLLLSAGPLASPAMLNGTGAGHTPPTSPNDAEVRAVFLQGAAWAAALLIGAGACDPGAPATAPLAPALRPPAWPSAPPPLVAAPALAPSSQLFCMPPWRSGRGVRGSPPSAAVGLLPPPQGIPEAARPLHFLLAAAAAAAPVQLVGDNVRGPGAPS